MPVVGSNYPYLFCEMVRINDAAKRGVRVLVMQDAGRAKIKRARQICPALQFFWYHLKGDYFFFGVILRIRAFRIFAVD